MIFFDFLKKTKFSDKLFFLVLAISSNYYMLNIGQSDRTLPFNAAVISLSVVFILFAFGDISNKGRVIFPQFLKVSIIIISVLLSPLLFMKSDLVEFTPRLLMIFGVLVLYLSFCQLKVSSKHILWGIVTVGLFQVAWGIYQITLMDFERPYGIFQQVNVYGSFLATVFAISGFLAARTKGRGAIPFLLILPASCIILVDLTTSRTAMIGIVISALMLLPVLFRKSIKFSVKVWFVSAILGVIIVITPRVQTHLVSPSVEVAQGKSIFSKTGREFIYPQVLKLANENFLTGVGFENFDNEYLNRTADWFHQGEMDTYGLHNLDYPHSELLYWYVEGGIFSLIGIISLIILILYRVSQVIKGWEFAFLSLIAPISIHILLEFPLYQSQLHLFLFVSLIYVINTYSRDKISYFRIAIPDFLTKGLQLAMMLFSIAYLSSITYANYLMINFSESDDKNPKKLTFLHSNWLLGVRYERHYQEAFIRYAINNRSESLVKEYIEWAEVSVDKDPFLSEYRYLIFAYYALENERKASEVKLRADYLYPKFDIGKRTFNVPTVIKGT